MVHRRLRDQLDWPLFVAVSAVATIGLLNLYSATSARPEWSEIYIQHIYWLTLGVVTTVLIGAVDSRFFERHAWILYGGGLVLLVLVFLLGRSVRGSQRWIALGSFSLQPSELMKLGLILALAKYLHNDPKTEGRTLKDLVVPGLILAVPMGLVLAEPDLGTALILAAIFVSIMLLTHLRLRALVTLMVGFVLSAPLTWSLLLKDYQRERLLAFLFPETDIHGTGWHALQSRIAIGSGGLLGKGFMQSTQNQLGFLPDPHTDFPFAVWAEEYGLLGVMVLFGLYVFIVLWGLRIASLARDRFGAVTAVGVTAMFFWHAVVNLGMVLGLLPVVGVTLPLVSKGGSSILTIMAGVGWLMSISTRRFSS